jgi:integrase
VCPSDGSVNRRLPWLLTGSRGPVSLLSDATTETLRLETGRSASSASTTTCKYGFRPLRPARLAGYGGHQCLCRGADLGKVHKWLGHANVWTTRLYDRHRSRPEDSPTFRVAY